MNVIIVGSNPSQRSAETGAFCPSTKSRTTLDSWFKGINVNLDYDNVVDYVTENNRPLRISEIRGAIPELKQRLSSYNRIITVGKTAAKALEMTGLDHFQAPHPSGLNRFWNDQEAAADMIERIRDYVRAG